jgi:hypothetical protein
MTVQAQIWVDKDGSSFITLENERVTIFSTDSFFYFDQLFSRVLNQNEQLDFCVGFDDGPGMASDCYFGHSPQISFYNEGKTRAMHFDISQYPFLFAVMNDYLNRNIPIKVSINTEKLFASYSIQKEHLLTEEALKIIRLPN